MTEYGLPPEAGTVDLGDGYRLYASKLPGTVRIDEPPPAARDLAASPLDAVLQQSGLRLDKVITLPAAPPPAASSRALADAQAAEAPSVTLDISPSDDESYILLVEDNATHALQWVVPKAPEQVPGSGARALRTSLRFEVPLRSAAHPEGARGLADTFKTIKAFAFKITDALLGPLIHGFARKWETQHRPTFTRAFGPDNYRNDDPDFPHLDDAGWRQLSQGRALLFVHGTFSTCGTFAPLDAASVAELSRRYGGRMFAFNHPTMTADPRENALAFLSSIPPALKLEIDIVCHSRGGLVAREIAALGQVQGSLTVRQIVFVAATNQGTVLADADHMVDMIDRFTTIAKFLPPGPVLKIVDALVLAVKVIGHGFLDDLEGLKAMDPQGPFMEALNVAGPASTDFFAMASDFSPKPGTPFFSLTRVEDMVLDAVFSNVANDLVVPRDGVFAKNGAGGFPIGTARCLLYGPADGVIHTEFFSQPRTAAKLLEWLEPTGADAREFLRGPSLDQVARALDAFRDHALASLSGRRGLRGSSSGVTFTPAELEALRPHVITLREGGFDPGPPFSTAAGDVDAILREHIPKWAQSLPNGQPLRIVIWAHGGLVGESRGLQIAQKHVDWWKKNGVYPVYFVWETGLFDALRSILESVARKLPGLGTRDLFDFTTDPLVQEGVRALGGVHIWGAMKSFAELASRSSGGARYFAKQLTALVKDSVPIGGRALELHAVGHSAGSIFHSWFLPAAQDEGAPQFATLQLLAPAITVAEFQLRLGGGLAKRVARSIMYTMKKSFEEADDCIGIYHKSLLYLIYHGLEPQRRTPILGLELAIRADAEVAALFGLNGTANAPGRVVWSITDDGDGRSSSRAVHHGDFDDDALTMNSVAANVLNEPRARVPYTGSTAARALDGWPISDDWLAGVDTSSIGAGLLTGGSAGGGPQMGGSGAPSGGPMGGGAPSGSGAAPGMGSTAGTTAGSITGGARRALCVGIDAYPCPNTLTGCVNDTVLWRKALEASNFHVDILSNANATRAAIIAALRNLVTTAKRGDVIVFHYSGHGTQVPAVDADEGGEPDEAIVPVDFESGAFLIDEDIRQIFDLLPDGVNLTAFIDCCHSGTITRMLMRNADIADSSRSRFLKKTARWEDWMRAHERFREHVSATQSMAVGSRSLRVDRNALRWVTYSACLASQEALESDGNGDFSRNATRLLTAGLSRYTHRSFQDAVLAAFGENRKQTPYLDCPDASLSARLLEPLA